MQISLEPDNSVNILRVCDLKDLTNHFDSADASYLKDIMIKKIDTDFMEFLHSVWIFKNDVYYMKIYYL